MRVVFEKTINGVTQIIHATTPATGDQGLYVRALVGAGNPFWAWNSVPLGKIIACDFSEAPICSSDTAVNNALIAGITVMPLDVLTYL